LKGSCRPGGTPVAGRHPPGPVSPAKALTLDCFDAFGSHCHQTSAGWQDGKLVYAGEMQVEGKWMTLDRETCTRSRK
jgi:hypothetical protein